jgi:hypothetical protein
MQALFSALASALALFLGLNQPQIIEPKNVEPHNHTTEPLYITHYEAVTGTVAGYCAAWAVSVAERYEGHRKGEPSLREWLKTSQELRIDPLNGGAALDSIVKYYERRNYSITFAPLVTNECDAQYMVANALDNRCVAMVLMFEKGVGGHVETILGSEQCTLHTNSWGTEARIDMEGGYHHDNMTMFTTSAEAFVMTACPVN